jgi:hypothetical protein
MADLYLSLGDAVNGLSFINVPQPETPLDPLPALAAPVVSNPAGEDEAVELALLQGQVLTLVGFDSAVGGIFTI